MFDVMINGVRVRIDVDDHPVRQELKAGVDALVDEMIELCNDYNKYKIESDLKTMKDCLNDINELFGNDFNLKDFGVMINEE